MEKEREKSYNGSYLYKLNEELSGQAELDPYFVTSLVDGEGGSAADAGSPANDAATEDEVQLSDAE